MPSLLRRVGLSLRDQVRVAVKARALAAGRFDAHALSGHDSHRSADRDSRGTG